MKIVDLRVIKRCPALHLYAKAQVEFRFTRIGLVVLSLTRGIFGLKTLQALKTAGCPCVINTRAA